jgi:large subunit ribosomal protein L25
VGGGMVTHAFTELDVKCLPKDLPGFIEVDLKDLQAGQAMHLSELKLPEGVELAHHGEGDPVIAGVVVRGAGASSDEVAAEAAVETQVITEKKPAAAPEKKAEKK